MPVTDSTQLNAASNFIVELTPENAQSVLYEASASKLVVLYFWSQTCSHCVTIGPVLESIASEYADSAVLAKVNCDEQPNLPSQFGVRSLPTVMLVKNAQSLGGFSGAKSESEMRALLEEHLPKPWEIQMAQAMEYMANDDFSAAMPLLKSAFQDSNQRPDIATQYARTLTALKRLEEAQVVLDTVKEVYQDADFAQVKAQLELAQEAGKSPDIEALEKEYEQQPEDAELGLKLAIQYSQHQYTKEALEILYTLLQKNLSCLDGEVKKTFTDILSSLEKGDALASEYQRKLYTLLY